MFASTLKLKSCLNVNVNANAENGARHALHLRTLTWTQTEMLCVNGPLKLLFVCSNFTLITSQNITDSGNSRCQCVESFNQTFEKASHFSKSSLFHIPVTFRPYLQCCQATLCFVREIFAILQPPAV